MVETRCTIWGVSVDSARNKSYKPIFRLQWNVLADGLAQHGEFVSCAKEHLAWPYRFALMLDEIEQASPDIITLQECNHFRDTWMPAMEARGFQGIHVAKPSSPATFFGAPSDGLAVFWKKSHLEITQDFNFQYSKYLEVPSNQMAVLMHFNLIGPLAGPHDDPGLIVATTHLKSKETEVRPDEHAAPLQSSLHAPAISTRPSP